jgi:hypothetical protein
VIKRSRAVCDQKIQGRGDQKKKRDPGQSVIKRSRAERKEKTGRERKGRKDTEKGSQKEQQKEGRQGRR